LNFGNAAARAVVAALSDGPASLTAIIAASGLAEEDVQANLLVLCAVGAVWPVESRAVAVAALNEAIRRRLGGPAEIRHLGLPHGTALPIEDGWRGLVDGRSKAKGKTAGWPKFLASHGL
jgi:hypothetical protein